MTALAECSSLSCRAQAPLVVGGNGGSGTRVVAEILARAGVYLGADLNAASDNLTFTYVFKHPSRYAARPEAIAAEQDALFALHERLFFGRGAGEWRRLFWRCARDHALHRYGPGWVAARWRAQSKAGGEHRCLWGWKEPNTMYFLDGLKRCYPQAKYIQVIRHGLDMVYTRNDQQYDHWARRYGMDPADDRDENHFAFWYRSNRQACEEGERLFGAGFALVRYEDLILAPEESIRKLLDFAGLPQPGDIAALAAIPRKPSTFQRYKQRDLSWVDRQVRDQLAFFQFEVE